MFCCMTSAREGSPSTESSLNVLFHHIKQNIRSATELKNADRKRSFACAVGEYKIRKCCPSIRQNQITNSSANARFPRRPEDANRARQGYGGRRKPCGIEHTASGMPFKTAKPVAAQHVCSATGLLVSVSRWRSGHTPETLTVLFPFLIPVPYICAGLLV